MKLSLQNSKVSIFDEVFEPDHWNIVREHVKKESFRSLLTVPSWIKTWRLGDGVPMFGTEYFSDQQSPPAIEMVKLYVKQLIGHSKATTDWTSFTLVPYLYPRGTKISWHNDYGYKAAAIFYTHTNWGSTWGGELMLAETPPETASMNGQNSQHLEHDAEDEFIGHFALGTYISPKPNRCVITPGGVWHSINRVDADAGDHVRSSIVVFFR